MRLRVSKNITKVGDFPTTKELSLDNSFEPQNILDAFLWGDEFYDLVFSRIYQTFPDCIYCGLNTVSQL